MSKKHPGINQWKQHIQLGRRKPGAAAAANEEPATDARKPPGWQGRAAKAKDRRSGAASRPPKPAASVPAAKTTAERASTAAPAGTPPAPVIGAPKRAQERPLDGEGRPYITLVQFLKTIDVVGTGGAGKHTVRAGGILVNGVEDLRPGRKLHTGDVVTVAGVEHNVTV